VLPLLNGPAPAWLIEGSVRPPGPDAVNELDACRGTRRLEPRLPLQLLISDSALKGRFDPYREQLSLGCSRLLAVPLGHGAQTRAEDAISDGGL
jgi:hypothetical protein